MDKINLLFGEPLILGNLVFRHPTVNEILEVGEDFYHSCINIFTLRPYDMMVDLYDSGIDYEKMENYDLFVLMCGETLKEKNGKVFINKESNISKSLEWLTGIPDFFLCSKKDEFFLYSKKTGLKIDKAIYYSVHKYFIDMMFIEDKDEFNPGNATTKKFLIEQKRKELKRKAKKKNNQFASNISSLVWSSGITFEEVKKLHIYQLNDGLHRINKLKNYEHVCIGYFTGHIESSAFRKMQEDLNWMNN